MVAPDPVFLPGASSAFDAREAVGKAIQVGDSAVSVQVLRPAEVSKLPDQALPGLTSEVKPVVPLTLADAPLDGIPVGSMSVTVLSTEESMKAGFDGLAFAVDPSPELAAAKEPVTLRFEIDLSKLQANYGAEWASRVALLATDSCRLAKEVAKDCSPSAFGLPAVVYDVTRQVLVVEVDLNAVSRQVTAPTEPGFGASYRLRRSASSGGPGFGLSAGASSVYGNFAATSLAGSQRWSVSGNTGGFSWSYPISGPSTPGGSASTSLSYSSQAVDGLTADENTQGGQIGVGWSAPSSYIERRYKNCSFDGVPAWLGMPCWYNDNAVLSLNGQSGELVKDASGGYHLENDPGWRISHFQSSTEGVGSIGVDGNKEYWVVTTQDGTQYWFGFGKEKGTSADTPGSAGDPGTATNSVWTEPVAGNNPGEPCYTLSLNWCHQAYRWMLDRVVTSTGITSTYFYDVHVNTFGRQGAPAWATKYTAGGELVRVEYGQLLADADVANRHPAQIVFNYSWRCTTLDAACPQPTSANGSQFPDIPADEICGETATYCLKYAPTFFDWKVLNSVYTDGLVNDATTTAYHRVDEYKLTTVWVDNDDQDANNANKLWLRSIEHTGRQGYDSSNGQTSLSSGLVWFDSYNGTARLANRSDAVLPTVVRQKYYRINMITDELGSRTNVSYSAEDNNCIGVGSGWDTNTKRCYARYYNPSSGSAGYVRGTR